ncbi:MAG: iron-containing alcohol dehydrogenase [Betaproteobacteria bacterium]|jgi:alcohol dehydrogenase class IV|nr:iron-containing alcohol dehydrogenase [Betaproteobacteria bacterium]MBK7082488.1 iron-containing alcohol dehydrogenase [Betaproteobacteria bacterium]MBK8689961.1 iron-containing alcohol dehydrogenase [Betaproteobacteria bacterium]MBL0291510.1 iron-containing alcohol dehydrogenase [Betaproteobacteria bacterium]
MMEMPSIVGDVVRSVGLSTAMRAAGVVTGMLPIPQPLLLVGPGSSARLGQTLCSFRHRKILIVTDRIIAGMGLLEPLTSALSAGGTRYAVFDAVTADAPIPLIEKGIARFEKEGCDAIVAFGGGSPMDAAKTIALAVANRKHPRQLVGYFRGRRAPVPIYAVPTTAGTGSEVTVAAVVSDPQTNRKLVIADTRLVPAMAALDPALMTGLPRPVTAATGMDALTHAVEAFVGQWATAHTDRMALAAVGMIYDNLRLAYRSGKNLAAREQMALASTYAGLAFTRANVGYVHAIAHQLGGKYHTPHGLANAIMLPHVLRFLSPAITRKLAVLAVRAQVGKEGERPAALARKFIDSVDALNRDLGIPTQLDALREEDIPALAKAACWEADTNYPVPRYMSPEICARLIRQALPQPAAPRKARSGR